MNVYGELKHAQIEVDDTAAHGGATTRPVSTKVYNSITHTAYISNGTTWVLQTPTNVSSLSFVGEIRAMKTFGVLPIPRGWIPLGTSTTDPLLNYLVLNQAEYDGVHGAGAWVTDNVASSLLAGMKLPNINTYHPSGDVHGNYLIGRLQSADASADDGTNVPSLTGQNLLNIAHTHATPNHNHRYMDTVGDNTAGNTFNSGGSTIASGIAANGTGSGSDVLGPKSDGVDAYTEISGSGTTGSALSSSTNIKPRSFYAVYIMRVI